MENDNKRKILVSRSVNVEYEGILAQAGLSADTTLRIEVDPESLYPDPQAVTLLWLASTYTFHGLDLFEDFGRTSNSAPATDCRRSWTIGRSCSEVTSNTCRRSFSSLRSLWSTVRRSARAHAAIGRCGRVRA